MRCRSIWCRSCAICSPPFVLQQEIRRSGGKYFYAFGAAELQELRCPPPRDQDSGRNPIGANHAPFHGVIRPYDAVEGLTERVICSAIEVHRILGPGLLESPYRECLLCELVSAGLKVERERLVPVIYKGHIVSDALKIDLLVENSLVVEVKAIEAIRPVHLAQVITYLKLTGHPAGLLMNFNAVTLKAGCDDWITPNDTSGSRLALLVRKQVAF